MSSLKQFLYSTQIGISNLRIVSKQKDTPRGCPVKVQITPKLTFSRLLISLEPFFIYYGGRPLGIHNWYLLTNYPEHVLGLINVGFRLKIVRKRYISRAWKFSNQCHLKLWKSVFTTKINILRKSHAVSLPNRRQQPVAKKPNHCSTIRK